MLFEKRIYTTAFWCFILIGTAAFFWVLFGEHPERAWHAYLINFLLFSGIAQGGLLFSAVMNTTKARWSGPLSNLSESFAAFFPVSFILFILLFFGREHVFPWLHQDIHGKEIWLNIPFLFTRDGAGLLLLYGLGGAYLYYAFYFKLDSGAPRGVIRSMLRRRWERFPPDAEQYRRRKGLFGILYILAFALILSLLGYDLVMSADPHWYSTLFGAYTFVKAFYVGIGGLIFLAALLHMNPNIGFNLKSNQFHDVGKLFFAFCLLWADFFYCQFVVIWYGNIPEETAYIIERTMRAPWNILAWFVFIVAFILPFLILLNRKIKTKPAAMAVICLVVIGGIWLEHFLVLGPAFYHHASSLPIGISDLLISFAFLGMLSLTISGFLARFPELVTSGSGFKTETEAG